MNNHDFNTIKVNDGTETDIYTAFPGTVGPYPALLLLQEAFGVNSHIRDVAERLCNLGYAVVAPDLFHRTVRRLETGYDDFSVVAAHFQALTNDGLSADLQACYDWLREREEISKEKIGSIGFCLGGRVSFLANTLLPLAAGVSYYGGGIDQLAGAAHKLSGPHLFYWGGKDTHITPEKRERVITAVKEAGKDYTNVVISYADHGFNCDQRAAYHPLAAKEAWAHTISFLDNRLK